MTENPQAFTDHRCKHQDRCSLQGSSTIIAHIMSNDRERL